MNKNFFYFSFLLFFVIILTQFISATVWDPLTKGQADFLYCPIGGICTLETLTVYDLYVIGEIFNVTVTNIYMNITYLQGIENYATKENLETNITYHEENFKHGNTTQEIRNQFSSSANISIVSGVISINKSFMGWDTDASDDLTLATLDNGSIVRSHNTSWVKDNQEYWNATNANFVNLNVTETITNVINITLSNGGKVWGNSTCIFYVSPAGTGKLEVCD